MAREFHTLDVFTGTVFAGNPLAVVPDATGLDEAQMLSIAREFNLSETVFIFPPENAAHSAKVRIFTPSRELPFAGHPTVGTAVHLATQEHGDKGEDVDAILVLEEQVGPVRIGVRMKKGEAAFAEFDIPKLPEEVGAVSPNDVIASALGLAPSDIGVENHKPTGFSAGVPFSFVPVADLDALDRATPVTQHWRAAFGDGDHPNAFVYCRQTTHHDATFHARMFAPLLGIPEDPATGGAAAAFTGVIMRFDEPTNGMHKGIIEQGYEMGRPSEIHYELEVEAGKLIRARIGGYAVAVSQGTLNV